MPSNSKNFVLGFGALASVFFALPSEAATRYSVRLDNGTNVTVDTTTGWTLAQVTTVVLAADRSTQDGCPFDATSFKGLFKSGDRLFLNTNYLAWLDYTQDDGVVAPSNWHRGGELAGVWVIDPNAKLFRYYTTSPGGCSNWPRNLLLPGSASPNRQYLFWDKNSPPIEHSFLVHETASNPFPLNYFSYHYGARAANGGWHQLVDGADDGDVHYKTTSRMANQWNKPIPGTNPPQFTTVYMTDTFDGEDGNGVQSFVQAELEYVMRSTDILSVWRFSSSSSMTTNNLLMGAWLAYAYNTNPGCQPGNDMPPQIFGQPRYARSNLALNRNFDGFGHFGAGTILQLSLGTQCNGTPQSYLNADIYTDNYPPGGSWIQWGQSPSLDPNQPLLTFTIMGAAYTGAGTNADPIRLPWKVLNFSTETHDGVIGGGSINMDPINYTAGTWYQGKFSLRPGS